MNARTQLFSRTASGTSAGSASAVRGVDLGRRARLIQALITSRRLRAYARARAASAQRSLQVPGAPGSHAGLT